MKFLRTISTARLLALIAGLVVAIGAVTAIAVAASGPGPIPKHKSLAKALHAALTAPAVTGISARVSFTNNLIGSSDLAGTQASDPILTGSQGRLWLSDHHLRLELQSSNGDAQVVVDNSSFWVYDPVSHTVYEGSLPAGHSSASKHARAKDAGAQYEGIPTIAQIQTDLNKLVKHLNVSGAIPSDVAGHAAYTVRIRPKHDGGLLGAAEVAWDAVRGVPLRIAVYARNNSSPVLQLEATDISYGKVSASDFNVSPPPGSKVVKISTTGHGKATSTKSKHGKRAAHVSASGVSASGVAAVAAKVPFKLMAPRSLVGLPRHTVSLLSWGGKPAALVTYGQNLGGIAVIEQTPSATGAHSAAKSSSSQSGAPSGLSLPTVSINGATGQELDTALGTVLTFSRGGVGYTVLGSVPSAAADAAARAL
jgi:outer membrane lipoprotein-sorting protein